MSKAAKKYLRGSEETHRHREYVKRGVTSIWSRPAILAEKHKPNDNSCSWLICHSYSVLYYQNVGHMQLKTSPPAIVATSSKSWRKESNSKSLQWLFHMLWDRISILAIPEGSVSGIQCSLMAIIGFYLRCVFVLIDARPPLLLQNSIMDAWVGLSGFASC